MENENNNTLKNTKVIEGRYANCFQIGQNELEFLIDFGQSYCQCGEEDIHTRIICNPFYVKVLLELLQKSIKQYEDDFGSINDGTQEDAKGT
jgi:hypothetical protein